MACWMVKMRSGALVYFHVYCRREFQRRRTVQLRVFHFVLQEAVIIRFADTVVEMKSEAWEPFGDEDFDKGFIFNWEWFIGCFREDKFDFELTS